jgi:hypothetical protein
MTNNALTHHQCLPNRGVVGLSAALATGGRTRPRRPSSFARLRPTEPASFQRPPRLPLPLPAPRCLVGTFAL